MHLRTFESLSIPAYRNLWLGQLSTSMGQWMDQVSRAWLVYQMTGSAWQLGLVSAARGIPVLAFGSVAGVVADRYGRKAQLIIAQSVNAVLNVILATLILTGNVQIWHVYVTAVLNGTVQAFQQPARQVLINDLVGEKHLLNAISLNSAVLNLSRSIGPAAGGVLIALWGVDTSYFVQAGLFALATIWTARIVVPPAATAATAAARAAAPEQSMFASMREGFAYIASNKVILALIILGLAPIMLGMPFMSLLPLFAIDVFQGGAETQGLLLTAVGVGAVIGALVTASLGKRQVSVKLLLGGAAGFGLSLVAFAQSPVVGLAMVFALVAGLFNSSYTSQNQTMIQMIVPGPLRGRVLGTYLLNRGLQPLGSLLAGGLAELMGGPWSVTVMGILCFLLVVATAWAVPALRKLDLTKTGAIS